MTSTCFNCGTAIQGTPRGYHVRAEWRALCASDLQGCAERGVALRLGIPIATQRAFFVAQARGLVRGTVAELAS